MEFIKFLYEIDHKETLFIIIISVVYGVSTGLMIPLVLTAAMDIITGKSWLMWTFLLTCCFLVQMISFQISEGKTAKLANQALENILISIMNTIRHDELQHFEQRNHSEIRMSVGEAGDISEGIAYNIRIFQSMVIVFALWVYTFYLSSVTGLIFLAIYGLIIMAYDVVRQLNTSQFIRISETENRLFNIFHHFLNGFKEIKIDLKKNNDLFSYHLTPIINQFKELRYQLSFFSSDFNVCFYAAMFTLIGIEIFFNFSHQSMILIVCTFYIVKPSVIAISSLPRISQGQAALVRLKSILKEKKQFRETEGYIFHGQVKTFEKMIFQDVIFEYTDPDRIHRS